MFRLGIAFKEKFAELLSSGDPEKEIREPYFIFKPIEGKPGIMATVMTESPLSQLLIASGLNCISTLSPTLGESELSSISAFMGKRLAYMRSYIIRGNKVDFPTGKSLPANILETLAERFGYLIVDATFSFLERNNGGSLLKEDHLRALSNEGIENALFFLRLHEIFNLFRYPAYMILSPSTRAMETILLLSGWKRNGVALAYKELVLDEAVRSSLRSRSERLMRKAIELEEYFKKRGAVVIESDTPYFISNAEQEFEGKAQIVDLSMFIGEWDGLRLFAPNL
jgi:hypothetical protein